MRASWMMCLRRGIAFSPRSACIREDRGPRRDVTALENVERWSHTATSRESAMAATQWGADLASDIHVPLVLAHVVEPVVVPPRWQALVADFESDRVASGQRMLARLSGSFCDTHTDCVVSVGRPADTIASLAVEYGAGLVVMGLANPEDSEPRNPGSIAYRVLRTAHVAVVVVPHSKAQAAPDRPASRHASLIA
jgi:nucleotide-binding universal stress UspA family protein